jgi:ubiquinone biosynthesis protein UbiJ
VTESSGSGGRQAGSSGASLPPGLAQLAAVLADALGELANASLGLDPTGAARLAELNGTRAVVRARAPAALPAGPEELAFTFSVEQGRLRLRTGAVEHPHAVVSGSLGDLISWALSRGRETSAGLRIEGDTRLFETLAALARDYRPDLQGPLGRLLGPTAAARLIDAAELAAAGVRSVLQTAASGVRQGAGEWFATEQATAGFLDELDELRLAVDRLEARVSAAEARAGWRAPDTGRPMP